MPGQLSDGVQITLPLLVVPKSLRELLFQNIVTTVLFLVIIVHLLLCLTCTLNFVTGMHI